MGKLIASPHRAFFLLSLCLGLLHALLLSAGNKDLADNALHACWAAIGTGFFSLLIFGPHPLIGEDS